VVFSQPFVIIYMNSYAIPVIYPLVQYDYMKFIEEFCCVRKELGDFRSIECILDVKFKITIPKELSCYLFQWDVYMFTFEYSLDCRLRRLFF
jgi:hypothetical protein